MPAGSPTATAPSCAWSPSTGCSPPTKLAQVFFGSRDRAEHRLRELTDARALARFRPHRRHGEGSAPFHYVLGSLAAAILAAEQGIDPHRHGYRPDKALAIAHSQRLRHTVGVNGFFTALAAHARWREADGEVDLFLEHDRGIEPTERLAAKLAGYQDLANASQTLTPVLFWLPSPAREHTVRQAIASQTRWTRLGSWSPPPAPPSGSGPPSRHGSRSDAPGHADAWSTYTTSTPMPCEL